MDTSLRLVMFISAARLEASGVRNLADRGPSVELLHASTSVVALLAKRGRRDPFPEDAVVWCAWIRASAGRTTFRAPKKADFHSFRVRAPCEVGL